MPYRKIWFVLTVPEIIVHGGGEKVSAGAGSWVLAHFLNHKQEADRVKMVHGFETCLSQWYTSSCKA